MKILLTVLALSFAPSIATAEDKPPVAQPGEPRLVPAMKDGVLVGLKLYAIRKDTRLEKIGFQNGDTLTKIDGEPVITEAGTRAVFDKLIRGTDDVTIELTRRGQTTTVRTAGR
jgi:C-terminal processing protease CtpA/Prc